MEGYLEKKKKNKVDKDVVQEKQGLSLLVPLLLTQ